MRLRPAPQKLRLAVGDAPAKKDQQAKRQEQAEAQGGATPPEQRRSCPLHDANCQSGEDRQVVTVVTDRVDPASEGGLLVLQPREFAVTSVENTRRPRYKRRNHAGAVAARTEQPARVQA